MARRTTKTKKPTTKTETEGVKPGVLNVFGSGTNGKSQFKIDVEEIKEPHFFRKREYPIMYDFLKNYDDDELFVRYHDEKLSKEMDRVVYVVATKRDYDTITK